MLTMAQQLSKQRFMQAIGLVFIHARNGSSVLALRCQDDTDGVPAHSRSLRYHATDTAQITVPSPWLQTGTNGSGNEKIAPHDGGLPKTQIHVSETNFRI